MSPINSWQFKHVITCLILGVIILVYGWQYHSSNSISDVPENPYDYFVTAKGRKHLGEIIENVFQKFGYTFVKNDLIPVLRKTVPMNCYDVFSESQKITKDTVITKDAPKELINPEEFLLNNYSTLSKYYCNQVPTNDKSALPVWEEKFVDDYVNMAKIDPRKIPATYGNESLSVFYGTKYFNINGQNGAVIGSLSPWVESFLLANGAKHVTTIEYQKIKILHPQLSFLYAPDLPAQQKTYNNYFDFVVSFSSIEHSGLGRFGDPMDPIGDIREMNKIRCLLKNGGLLFFAVPVGKDSIEFNAHRIYGRMRLAMMFEGFQILQVFYNDAKSPIELKLEMLEKGFNHYLFVLQKID